MHIEINLSFEWKLFGITQLSVYYNDIILLYDMYIIYTILTKININFYIGRQCYIMKTEIVK